MGMQRREFEIPARLALFFMAMAAAALAETPVASRPRPADTVEFDLMAVSDYRPRGASYSDLRPAIQASAEAVLPLGGAFGVYAGAWGSSLDRGTGLGHAEIDLAAGLTGAMGDIRWRAGYARILFPSAPQPIDFDQLRGAVDIPVGGGRLTMGVVRSDYEVGRDTWAYLRGRAPLGRSGLALTGSAGLEEGLNWNAKLDWSAGVELVISYTTLRLTYVDTDAFVRASNGRDNLAGGAILLTLGLRGMVER